MITAQASFRQDNRINKILFKVKNKVKPHSIYPVNLKKNHNMKKVYK